jgi:hypothetical protein
VVSLRESAPDLDVAARGKLPNKVVPAIDNYRSSFFGDLREPRLIDFDLLEAAVGQSVEKYEA